MKRVPYEVLYMRAIRQPAAAVILVILLQHGLHSLAASNDPSTASVGEGKSSDGTEQTINRLPTSVEDSSPVAPERSGDEIPATTDGHSGATETTIEQPDAGNSAEPRDEHQSAEKTTEKPQEITTSAEQPMTTTPTTESTNTEEATTSETPTKKSTECPDTKYCFNGGKCVINESGYPHCICIEGFYGNRCQTKDICKSVIVDSLTGDQICAKLSRACYKNDKFFRCSCHADEYFVFKLIAAQETASGPRAEPSDRPDRARSAENLSSRRSGERLINLLTSQRAPQDSAATFAYNLSEPEAGGESTIASIAQDGSTLKKKPGKKRPGYLAECRKIDKCLGARCRQLSEVCVDGECVCNHDAGYVSDPTAGGLCKLLDPCSMPSTHEAGPICGQAQCVATFGRDLYRCLCPVGHYLIQVSDRKSSSVCVPLNDAICDVPLLNKCQHLCHIDLVQKNYKCSCFRGYKPGKRPGIDDHMCFFDEHTNEPPPDMDGRDAESSEDQDRDLYDSDEANEESRHHIFRWYKIPQLFNPDPTKSLNATKFAYDPKLEPVPAPARGDDDADNEKEDEEEAKRADLLMDSDLKSLRPHQFVIKREPRDSWDEWDAAVAKMSAQERCNRMCGENRICVLENGSNDSYRCICDRQGYVSIADKCLDWCAAAEFSLKIRMLLFKYNCWTQVCKPTDVHPQRSPQDESSSGSKVDGSEQTSKLAEEEERRLATLSSWRPKFECDCSSSPFLKQDPNTRLCQLDFRATLEPCLPGNVGYIDCVENKNAYCAVLHRSSWSFIKDLIHDKYKDLTAGDKSSSSSSSSSSKSSGAKSKSKQAELKNEKLYTCVCSPDKKFLVDKPRNKERCVDECNMLNIECVRFNRMCRSASIAPDDFGRNNLVRYDLDGAVKMNFRRTGCECLPGFNVGSAESVDFTLDGDEDEQRAKDEAAAAAAAAAAAGPATPSPKDPDGYPMLDIVDSDDILDQAERIRVKYINIDSSCLLDYDVVEFHASFKSPADFDPSWIRIKNPLPEPPSARPASKHDEDAPKEAAGAGGADCALPGRNGTCAEGASGELGAQTHHQSSNETGFYCEPKRGCQLRVPKFMRYDITDLHKNIVLVAQCEPAAVMQSLDAYRECVRYRYWLIQKLRRHYVDWRRVVTDHLSETFDLMDGNIRLRVNRCEATLKRVSITAAAVASEAGSRDSASVAPAGGETTPNTAPRLIRSNYLDPLDPQSVIDADIDCELTLHSASDGSSPRYSRKVLLEKQLQRFIFREQAAGRSRKMNPSVAGSSSISSDTTVDRNHDDDANNYYLMAPNMLIKRDSFDQLADHRKLFNPCESDYAYCDMQTDCHMVDTVNFTCTCKFGYTPIGSRDIYYGDSRKEVCEDIDECLFDVCKNLTGMADCENTIGDYKCLCRNQYTGDNKRFCNHVCDTINCHRLHGKCRIVAPHHALCECEDGYKEADCSVQDPNVALRKANMIIVGSIFTSVLLLMITLAISLNSQLKKTKKKLKRLEAINATANLFELHTPQPFRPRMSKTS